MLYHINIENVIPIASSNIIDAHVWEQNPKTSSSWGKMIVVKTKGHQKN